MISRNKLALVSLCLFGLLTANAAIAADTKADSKAILKVKLALLEKLGPDSLRVEVDANAGVLTLQGTVKKRETAELAATIAKSVSGVKSVDNQVSVEGDAENPSAAAAVVGEAEAELRDTLLATRVRLALVNKMGSDGFNITTVAANGIVTLRFGKEFDADRRNEANRLARDVKGVTKVVSLHKS